MNLVSTKLNKEVEKELDRMKNLQGISKSEIIRKIGSVAKIKLRPKEYLSQANLRGNSE